jgi:hypothetical protein
VVTLGHLVDKHQVRSFSDGSGPEVNYSVRKYSLGMRFLVSWQIRRVKGKRASVLQRCSPLANNGKGIGIFDNHALYTCCKPL